MFKIFKKIKDYGEVWHYTCENGHKWQSRNSPRGTYVFGINGQTECPICESTICIGDVYMNGKFTGMGSVHVDWKGK